jgi:phage tail sheath protein FI
MPVTTSYPGVYIEELPSNQHTINPATTSVTAFVGYTHPLKTVTGGSNPALAPAMRLFSFADYQTNFGGFFNSPYLPDYVGRAVFQFFQNGGGQAYVVGLTDPNYVAAQASIPASPSNITLTAREPVGVGNDGISMSVSVTNLQKTTVDNDTADIVITYGTTQVETHRKVVIGTVPDTLAQSPLAAAAFADPSNPPTAYASASPAISFAYSPVLDPAQHQSINPLAIGDVFTDNFPLDKVDFNLLVIPGITDPAVLAEGVAYAERKRLFYIVDSPQYWEVDAPEPPPSPPAPESPADGLSLLPVPVSTNAAIYYPWLQVTDLVTNTPSISPPSGFVAGIYAKTDTNRGVWKTPAGLETTLTGTLGVVQTGVMTDNQQGVLNNLGINCLRGFLPEPPVVWGGRTLAYNNPALKAQWGYIAVRRMALFLEQTLYSQLNWAIFEPNDKSLWDALTLSVSAFMLGLFRQGAFAGGTPSTAFLVQCDNTTTTQADIDNGKVNILVGFAPLKPAEFVVVQITQLAGQNAT